MSTFQPAKEALGADDFGSVGEVDLLEDVHATAAEPAPVTDADVVVKPAEVDLDGLAVVAGALAAQITGGARVEDEDFGRRDDVGCVVPQLREGARAGWCGAGR
ncbi:hypothetical protein [Streptomyces sp. NPDC001508]|uniref:hypothetical protein n=1 Tax=Streptomyces sp. NPDC001508 TaxID=3154656 RepID=UPI00331E8321